jgi:ABC-2 type transport system permease protein
MNTQSNTVHESPLESQAVVPLAVISPARRMYWSVRRELWENRSIYIAPLAVAGVFLVGFLIGLVTLPGRMRAVLALDPAKLHAAIEQPYVVVEELLMGASLIVAVFYCLEALHGERRDRSILFWKSLPVSDLTAVLAKASVPFLLVLLCFVVTVAAQLIMLLLSSSVLAESGLGVAPLWTHVSLFQRSLGLGYHYLTVHALWYAPIYGWLLLVSAWARRAAFVWAILPPLAIGVVEKIAFNTSHFADWLGYRFSGPQHFDFSMPGGMAMDLAMSLDLGRLLITPGLWTGLIVAAAFLLGAVRLRRNRGPI